MIRLLIGVLFVLSAAPLFTLAQETSTFSIRLFGAEDLEAPSTTTISSIVPVSASQIDLTWGVATDNYTVFGYVVFRDGLAIATTTALSYSDTSLAASTTYSYTVRAFDGVPNYASSSIAAATTTLETPPVVTPTTPTTTNTTNSTRVKVFLDSFSLDVGVATASVAVETSRPSRIEIRIGESSSYELGYLVGNTFSRDHIVPINDLRPDTKYYYEIVGYSSSGRQTVLRSGSFTTLSDEPPLAPTNVRNFGASISGATVDLTWELPSNFPRNGLVRVVRSHYGYPVFINDGVVVYEGGGTSAVDDSVLQSHDRAFYTAFVIDPDGLISSGAIAQIAQVRPGGVGVAPNDQPGSGEVLSPALPGQDLEPISFNPDMPKKRIIEIEQSKNIYSFASSSVTLSGNDLFSVRVTASEIKGDFKTVIATLGDPRGSGKTFSFLLRLNADRSAYVATIAPVLVNGISDLTVEIYDYDALVMARYSTQVVFTGVEQTASSTIESWLYTVSSWLWASLLVVPFVVLLVLFLLFRRRTEEE